MKRFLTKYGIIALAIATMVVVTMGLLTFFSSSTGLFTNLVNSVAAPFRSASASFSQWVDDKDRYRKRMNPVARNILLGDLVFLAATAMLEQHGILPTTYSNFFAVIGALSHSGGGIGVAFFVFGSHESCSFIYNSV